MSSELQLRDVRWLHKLCRRIELAASKNYPHDDFRIRITSTEVARAKRIAQTLGWHIQHLAVSTRVSPGYAGDDVPRGNPENTV